MTTLATVLDLTERLLALKLPQEGDDRWWTTRDELAVALHDFDARSVLDLGDPASVDVERAENERLRAALKAYGITEAVLDQWEASAKADAERGRPWCANPNAILAVLPLIRAAVEAATPAPTPCAVSDLTALYQALDEIRAQYEKAAAKHAPMHSAHEGHSVIREELDELWEHVRADTGTGPEARHEAAQVAAMGLRYMLDVARDR